VAVLLAAALGVAAAGRLVLVLVPVPVAVVVKVDIAGAAAAAEFAFEVAAVVPGVRRFSQPVWSSQPSTERQLRHSLIKAPKSYLHQYELTQHGTELVEIFGPQEGTAGAYSSRDKE
jgi:hypothetical protein